MHVIAIRVLWNGAKELEKKLCEAGCKLVWSGYYAGSTEWAIGVETTMTADETQDFVFAVRPWDGVIPKKFTGQSSICSTMVTTNLMEDTDEDSAGSIR